MSLLTAKDIKEIKERLENRICPHCGGKLRVSLLQKGVDTPTCDVVESCCEQYKNEAYSLIDEEIKRQYELKIGRMTNF